MTDSAPIRRALLSVSDKTGLIPFAQGLANRGIELVSTGGTAAALKAAGIPVRDVADLTDFPEILGGRVKTLHPVVHGGILARRTPEHLGALAAHHIGTIDLVVVNLYPFAETKARHADWQELIEEIDIGGVALIRAAAKNYEYVTIVTSSSDYDDVLRALVEGNGATPHALRAQFAAKAFAHTAQYDAVIAATFAAQQGDALPELLSLPLKRQQTLRYGENPHQSAAFYAFSDGAAQGMAAARQLQGKELSYNNLNDADAAWQLVSEFDVPAAVIVKHANPCGAALGDTLLAAYEAALRCDPVSAFGGIIAVNQPLDGETAAKIAELFAEVVLAPSFTIDARAALAGKKNLRLLEMPAPVAAAGLHWRSVAGGMLLQTADSEIVPHGELRCVTERAPSESEKDDMLFAFTIAKHVKSNAIIYVKDKATLAIGAGQMSRVDAARIAAHKASEAGLSLAGSVVSSDAFFPFADGLLVCAGAGAKAVIQPGGSVRDAEVIKAADERGLAMLFTGMRHFRH